MLYSAGFFLRFFYYFSCLQNVTFKLLKTNKNLKKKRKTTQLNLMYWVLSAYFFYWIYFCVVFSFYFFNLKYWTIVTTIACWSQGWVKKWPTIVVGSFLFQANWYHFFFFFFTLWSRKSVEKISFFFFKWPEIIQRNMDFVLVIKAKPEFIALKKCTFIVMFLMSFYTGSAK